MDAWEWARIWPLGRSAGQSGRERPDMVEGRELGADPGAKATQRALREADDFATTGGVADMDRVGQVELRDERCEVIGVRVHVIAVPRLARAPVPTPAMGDCAAAAACEAAHPGFPCG